MDDTPRTGPSASPTEPVQKRSRTGMMWAMLAVVLAFLAGFGWQFYEAYNVREQLTAAEQELVVDRLRIRLGQAAMAAQMGEYEAARRQMSEFFSRLQDQGNDLPAGRLRVMANDFLAMRDDIITGLSRANPEYAGVLYGMVEDFTAAAEATGPADSVEQESTPSVGPEGTQESEPGATDVDTGGGMDAGLEGGGS